MIDQQAHELALEFIDGRRITGNIEKAFDKMVHDIKNEECLKLKNDGPISQLTWLLDNFNFDIDENRTAISYKHVYQEDDMNTVFGIFGAESAPEITKKYIENVDGHPTYGSGFMRSKFLLHDVRITNDIKTALDKLTDHIKNKEIKALNSLSMEYQLTTLLSETFDFSFSSRDIIQSILKDKVEQIFIDDKVQIFMKDFEITDDVKAGLDHMIGDIKKTEAGNINKHGPEYQIKWLIENNHTEDEISEYFNKPETRDNPGQDL